MAINVEKELAFIDLAADVLKISAQERAFMRKWVDLGHEYSSRLWELIIQHKAETKFEDVAHQDFHDGSEAKSASTRLNAAGNAIVGQISNVTGKTGYIRVACYNNWKKKIDFFLLPPNHNCTAYFSEAAGNRGSIRFSYSRRTNRYSNYLEWYRVHSLQDVCKKIK